MLRRTCKKLIDETRREIRLSPEAEKNVEFRTAPTPVPMHLGSGRLHRAIAILPDYINITTVTALRSNTLNDYLEYCYGWKVEDPADWLSGVAKLLLDSFVLSERAKKFLIARQAFMADSTSLGLFTTVFALCTYCFYFLVELLNKQMIRSGRSGAIVNFSIFLASGGLTFGNYHLMQYFHLKKLHEDADAKAISKGKYDSRQYEEARRMGQPLPVDPDYYEGAMEYYSKEIQRNRALRHLIRKRAGWFRDPSRQFTEDGDYQSWIFSTDPLSSRSLRAIVSWKLGSQRISD